MYEHILWRLWVLYFSVIMDHDLHCSFFIICRLCGKVPFQSDTATKLEESILKGDVKFREVEWITVSDKGTHRLY